MKKAALVFKKLFLFSSFYFLVSIFLASPVLAAVSLSLQPSSGSFDAGNPFTVSVQLNTGGAQTVGVDAMMSFNPQILKLDGIVFGELYDENNKSLGEADTTGEFYFSSSNASSAIAFSNTSPETLATLQFTAKAAGTSALTFDCSDGSLVDTNVWEQGTRGGDAVDLLLCSSATGGSYQVSGEAPPSTPTPPAEATATPTSAPGATATPAPAEEIPAAGRIINTSILSILGIGLVLLGLALQKNG